MDKIRTSIWDVLVVSNFNFLYVRITHKIAKLNFSGYISGQDLSPFETAQKLLVQT